MPRIYIFLLVLLLSITACKRSNYYKILSTRTLNAITFTSSKNETLGLDVIAIADRDSLEFNAIMPKNSLPAGLPGLDLYPSFDIEGFAVFINGSRYTGSSEALSFTNGQRYTCTLYSYDGRSTNYTLQVKNAEAWFTGLSFTQTDNPALGSASLNIGDIEVTEEQIEGNVIWFGLPHTISLKGLVPSFTTYPAGVRSFFVDSLGNEDRDDTSMRKARDFSDYCVYRVYDERDESFLDYKVAALRLKHLSFAQHDDIQTYLVDRDTSDGVNDLSVELPFGSDLRKLKPVFEYSGDDIAFIDSDGNILKCESGNSEISFDKPVSIIVSTKGGKKKNYRIAVTCSSSAAVEPHNEPNDPLLPDGSGTEGGNPVILPGEFYTVTYHANGGSGPVPADESRYESGDTVTIRGSSGLVRTGHSFNGWNTQADGSGDTFPASLPITMPGRNLDLYAIWSANSYTLTLRSNVHSETTETLTMLFGQTIALPAIASAFGTPEGFAGFAGWATSTAGSPVYADQANYTMNTEGAVLYARWSETAASAPALPLVKTVTTTGSSITVVLDNSDKSLLFLTMQINNGDFTWTEDPYPYSSNQISINGLSADTEYYCTIQSKDSLSSSPREYFIISTTTGSTRVYSAIYSTQELKDINLNASSLIGNYLLMKNLDISSESNWTPIGNATTPFKGIFEGSGRVINKLKIVSNSAGVGLFGYITSVGSNYPVIRNLGLMGCSISGGHQFLGALVGNSMSGIITNCYAEGNITSSYNGANGKIGGLIGTANGGSVTNCYANCSVSAGSAELVGGLIGHAMQNTAIMNCYSKGSVTGSTYVGGLVGYIMGVTVQKSFSNSMAKGEQHVGGLIGYAGNAGSTASSIENSYATGSVSEKIAGAGSRRGGLVGSISDSSTIKITYATGSVGGSSDCYGLVGYTAMAVQNSFYYQVPKYSDNTYGIISDVNAMKYSLTYTSSPYCWDFSSIWSRVARINQGFPYLKKSEPKHGLVLDALFEGGNVQSPATNHGATPTIDRKDIADNALHFTDENTYVDFGDGYQFACNQPFSISVWFKADSSMLTLSSNSFPRIVGIWGITQGLFEYRICLAQPETDLIISAEVSKNNGGTDSASVSITPENWYHAVLVYDTKKVALYLDGEFEGDKDYAFGSIPSATGPLYVGGPANGTSFNGDIDDLRVYNRALTPLEVSALYFE